MTRTAADSFYHDRKKVEDYVEMRKGVDGRRLVRTLRSLIPDGSRVLELGTGPGTDLLLLAQSYDVVGSDYSQEFIDVFSSAHPGIEILNLDAETIETDRPFDCVFSNKVLHHLARPQLSRSLQRQAEIVGTGGLLFHSFWLGDETLTGEGLVFTKYRIDEIVDFLSSLGEIEECGKYAEMNLNDSYYAAVRVGAQAGI